LGLIHNLENGIKPASMNRSSIKLKLAAATMLLIGASATHGQVCIDRPFIVRPVIEKSVIERPVFIRSTIMKPIIEQPDFIRATVEREVIDQPIFDRPIFDWCGDAYYAVDEATMGEAPALNRSLRGMLKTGQYTPGSNLTRAYLKAVRTPPANSGLNSAQVPTGAGSCCGDEPVRAVASLKATSPAAPKIDRFTAYRKQTSMRSPSPFAEQASNTAHATTAAHAVIATTMVVPRGSR
jgi:hypothetical protein